MNKSVSKITIGILIVSILLLAAIGLFLLLSLSPKRKLIGTWAYSQEFLGKTIETSYTFNTDETGILDSPLFGKMYFTYSVTGKHTIVITLDHATEYKFSIEGRTLTLTGNGQQLKMTKK